MDWFSNRKIRTKIMALIIIMATFIGIVGFIGYYYNSKANLQMAQMYSNDLLAVMYINDVRAESTAAEAAMFHFLLEKDKVAQQEQQNEISTRGANAVKSINAYSKLVDDPYEKERIQKIQQLVPAYQAERQKAIDLANQGDLSGAYSYFTKNALPNLVLINTTFKELADFNAEQANTTNSKNNVDYTLSIRIIIATSIMASLLCIMLGIMVARSIVKPLTI